jgi:putative tryptophan/tyrosine transport system substrate-binding protein
VRQTDCGGEPVFDMRRREFIAFVGGAAAWPLAARAQQRERARHIAALMLISEADPRSEGYIASFRQRLQELGWVDGRNTLIDVRWGAGDSASFRRYAAELIALAPDVVLAAGAPTVVALREISPTVPIVFVAVTDPVGAGIVASMARPRSNATGFTLFEFGIAAKWLELLKEIAPGMARVLVLRDATNPAGIGQFAAIAGLQEVGEIERTIAEFASGTNGGLVVTASQFGANHPGLIAELAARHKLASVYPFRYYVTSGGLISYGPDFFGQFRQAAGYVDRILKGEKPADLPVQAPTKYELVINLRTAKALGLDVPPSLLARADEVIE